MSSARAYRLVGVWSTSLWGQAEATGLVQPGEKMALEGPNSSHPVSVGRPSRSQGQGFNPQRHMVGEWETTDDETREVQNECVEKSFPHEDRQWGRCSERLCSLHPQGFQETTVSSLEKPDLTSELALLWAKVEPVISWGSFQCESSFVINPINKDPGSRWYHWEKEMQFWGFFLPLYLNCH